MISAIINLISYNSITKDPKLYLRMLISSLRGGIKIKFWIWWKLVF